MAASAGTEPGLRHGLSRRPYAAIPPVPATPSRVT